MQKLFVTLLSCFWLLIFSPDFIGIAFAEHPPAERCNIPITQVEILKEADNNLLPQQVILSNHFTKCSVINFGYTSAVCWIRFPLQYSCSANKVFVVSQSRTLDYIDFYLIRNGQIIDSNKTGFMRPLKTREKQITRFAFQVPSHPSINDTLYVKIRSHEGKLSTEFFIEDETTLMEKDNTERQTLFFFLGIGFLMMFFAFAYYISFKLKMFLWYILFLVAFLLHQVTNFGYGALYVWPDWLWFNNTSRVVWNVPALFALLMFSFQLLKVTEFCSAKTVKLFRWLKIILLIQILFPFIELPAYPWRFALYCIHCITILFLLVMLIYTAWKAIRRKYVPGYLFMAGEITILVIVVLIMMRNYNLIYIVVPDFILLYAGMVAMSLAMISMIIYTRKEYIKVVKEFVEAPKPEPKPLTEDDLEKLKDIFLKTETFFQTEKPYLNPDFGIKHLADRMNIPEHLLSKSINVKAGMHFFDYVNSFRVNEAVLLLADEKTMKQFTIEALARQCGFGNKTSFYKAFKKVTGKTPSDFQ
ncbi:MAG: 7TM diverse intracellular signaling domain-containing protein [Bacteroidota bacterium]